MGEYDHAMKVLINTDPLAIACFVLSQGERTRHLVEQGTGIALIARLNTEFPGKDAEKEYYKMLDLFKDSPAYEWMTETAREEGLARGREEAHQQARATFQQTALMLVNERFPKLARLARKQLLAVGDLEQLQRIIVHVSLSQNMAEVEDLLLDLDEQ